MSRTFLGCAPLDRTPFEKPLDEVQAGTIRRHSSLHQKITLQEPTHGASQPFFCQSAPIRRVRLLAGDLVPCLLWNWTHQPRHIRQRAEAFTFISHVINHRVILKEQLRMRSFMTSASPDDQRSAYQPQGYDANRPGINGRIHPQGTRQDHLWCTHLLSRNHFVWRQRNVSRSGRTP